MPSSFSSSWSASSSSWTTSYSLSSSLLHLCCIRAEISIESQSWLSYFWAAMASSSLLCTLPNTAAKVVSIVLITFCPNDNGGVRPPRAAICIGLWTAQRVESRGFGRKLRFIQILNQPPVLSLNCQDKLSISNLSSRNMGSSWKSYKGDQWGPVFYC